MNKALGCTLLSAVLVGGLALPAHASGLPSTDTTEGGSSTSSQVQASALTPAQAAQLRPRLRRGSRGPAVVYVQSTLGVTPTSGYYGKVTRKAVRKMQRKSGLKITGKVKGGTWKALLRPVAEAPSQGVSPEEAARSTPRLVKGSRGPAVVYVQQKLGVQPASGYYGPLTKAAVRRLQVAKGRKAHGRISSGMWRILLSADGVSAPPPQDVRTPEQAAADRPMLSTGVGPGDPAVVFVQQYLRVSPTSGYYGTLTTAAVRAYQTGVGITPTGTVGPLTWAAILAGRTPAPAAAGTAAPTSSTGSSGTATYRLPTTPTAADHALVHALAHVGKPYVLGGNGPDVFDCSGLIQQAYLSAGVSLPRLASQQRFAGRQVGIDDLRPGDLLYYQDGSSPRSGHISMYAGNGLAVEAANPRRGVRVRDLHQPWYRDRFVAATRIS